MGTAAEENQRIADRRAEAASASSNVVDLNAERDKLEEQDRWINKAAERYDAIVAERDMVNSNMNALLDEGEARGLDRKAMKVMFKQRKVDTDKREAQEATMRAMKRAFGWAYEQVDMFKAPAQQTELDAAGTAH